MAIVDAIDRGHDRFRDSVLATASEVCASSTTAPPEHSRVAPRSRIEEFLTQNGTLYICIPSEQHDLFAPLVVGLIEDVMRTKFARADAGPARPHARRLPRRAPTRRTDPQPAGLPRGGREPRRPDPRRPPRPEPSPRTMGIARRRRVPDALPIEGPAARHPRPAAAGEPLPRCSARTCGEHRPAQWPCDPSGRPHALSAPPAGHAIHIDGSRSCHRAAQPRAVGGHEEAEPVPQAGRPRGRRRQRAVQPRNRTQATRPSGPGAQPRSCSPSGRRTRRRTCSRAGATAPGNSATSCASPSRVNTGHAKTPVPSSPSRLKTTARRRGTLTSRP